MDGHPEGLMSPVLCPVSLWAQLMKEAGETPKTASFHDILTCPPSPPALRPRPLPPVSSVQNLVPFTARPPFGLWGALCLQPRDPGRLAPSSGLFRPPARGLLDAPPSLGRAGTWQGGLLGIPADPGLQLLLASLPSLLWPTRGQAILAPTGLPVQGPVTICQASSL